MHKYSLPYLPRTERLFSVLRHRPWAMWLDSGAEASQGRYDIVVAEPRATLVTQGGVTVLVEQGRLQRSTRDPLQILAEVLERWRQPLIEGLPFQGGAVGYFSYDLGMQIEGLDDSRPEARVPEMAVGIYDWAVVTDHVEARSYWVGTEDASVTSADVEDMLGRDQSETFHTVGELQRPHWNDYAAAFSRVQDYISAGDCYQVNLARPFRVGYEGDPFAAYQRLRSLSPAPYGAYLSLPFGQVLSNSPECFVQLRRGWVETRPIKGTRPRRADPAADRREAESLLGSEKDRAENVMIVDLLRNDIGKVCEPGSVTVPDLCRLESYANVHHLVSTVSGRLRADLGPIDLLRACLPGGSITGAPKHRAMEIIRELEPSRRGVYCGSIGFIGFDGSMNTSIAIRTAVCADRELSFWAGGGIVADSTAEAEFQEIADKASSFLRLAETSDSG